MKIRKSIKTQVESELKVGDHIEINVINPNGVDENRHWKYHGIVIAYTKEKDSIVLLIQTSIDVIEFSINSTETKFVRYRPTGLLNERFNSEGTTFKINGKDAFMGLKDNYYQLVCNKIEIKREWKQIELHDVLVYIPEGKEYAVEYISPLGHLYLVRLDNGKERLVNKSDSQIQIQFGISQ